MKHIKNIEKKVKNPNKGLPEEIFLFLTRISPMINVDLLIKIKKNKPYLFGEKRVKNIKKAGIYLVEL